MELILASTSPYRQQLLHRLGVPFRSVAPQVDEVAARRPEWTPQEMATNLASLKALDVANHFPAAFVIGSDQVAECEGQVLGKPGDRTGAIRQLTFLSGKTHTLWTAVACAVEGELLTHLDRTRLTMRPLTTSEIERYVDSESPWDCAGSYKFESRGITLFDAVETTDPTSIIGLPLMTVTTLLRMKGFAIP